MGHELPPGLSDAQRMALPEFYAGHISAGQLSQRLGLARPTSTDGSPQRQSRVWEAPRGGAARTGTASRRPNATARTIEGLLRLTPRRTAT
jgi:hypothetical protein